MSKQILLAGMPMKDILTVRIPVKTILYYALSFAIIFICLFIGGLAEKTLHAPIPGSILGMLLLFFLLVTGLVKVEWVQPGAALFLRWMVFLFLPVSVGLMNHFDTLLNNALPILASIGGGTLIVVVVLGLSLQHITKKGD